MLWRQANAMQARLYILTHTCTHARARAQELHASNNPSCFLSVFYFYHGFFLFFEYSLSLTSQSEQYREQMGAKKEQKPQAGPKMPKHLLTPV